MYYGFDMGGTKIELAVFDDHLQPLWQQRVATPKDDYQALLKIFQELTLAADKKFDCHGKVGIGIPGMINSESGAVFTTNVPAAQHKNLAEDLTECLNRTVKLENDANCFALSEAWHDEFQQYSTVLGLILGTGVGGGYIVNGQAISGKNGIAGEIGHLPLTINAVELLGQSIPYYPCGCGKKGCFEGYLSGSGFERLYVHFYHQPLSALEIIKRYNDQEIQATEHVNRYIELLAMYLASILTLFDPHLVVIGGGLSNFDELYRLLPKRLEPYLLRSATPPRIEKARYGDSGGSRGAACLNLERKNS